MSRDLIKALAPMARRIRLAAARAVLKGVADGGKLQTAQVALLEGEARDDVERFQNFGFTSVPLAGAEGVFISLNGSRDQGVLVAVDDRRSRLAGLEAGEAAIHNAPQTAVIVVKADGSITVTATVEVTVTAPLVRIVGNLEVTGNIAATGTIADGASTMGAMRATFNAHDHAVPQGGRVLPTEQVMT